MVKPKQRKNMMTPSNGKIFCITGPLCRGIHRSPVNSPHKGQWRGALMFSSIWAWINGCVNNGEYGDLRCHRAHYDVTVLNTFENCMHILWVILDFSMTFCTRWPLVNCLGFEVIHHYCVLRQITVSRPDCILLLVIVPARFYSIHSKGVVLQLRVTWTTRCCILTFFTAKFPL